MAGQAKPDGVDGDICRLVHQFAQVLDVNVRHIAESLGVTPTQVVALRELAEPMTARALAGRMSCEPSNVTFVLDRLERQDLIQRRPHPTDRRAKQIVLTEAGQRLRATVLDRLEGESALAPLTPAQQASLRDLLQVLVDGAPEKP